MSDRKLSQLHVHKLECHYKIAYIFIDKRSYMPLKIDKGYMAYM